MKDENKKSEKSASEFVDKIFEYLDAKSVKTGKKELTEEQISKFMNSEVERLKTEIKETKKAAKMDWKPLTFDWWDLTKAFLFLAASAGIAVGLWFGAEALLPLISAQWGKYLLAFGTLGVSAGTVIGGAIPLGSELKGYVEDYIDDYKDVKELKADVKKLESQLAKVQGMNKEQARIFSELSRDGEAHKYDEIIALDAKVEAEIVNVKREMQEQKIKEVLKNKTLKSENKSNEKSFSIPQIKKEKELEDDGQDFGPTR